MEYYCKLPYDVSSRDIIILDPMLATGVCNSSGGVLKEKGVKNIKLMCLIAAPEGVEALSNAHPDVEIYLQL